MSGIGAWFWGASQLDDAVDKATSELLPAGSEDIALNLEICDQIRSKSVPPKEAMRALKRRLNHKNPNVQLLALGLTDTCVKNGGDQFLAEVASREFIDNLVSILKVPGLNQEVKNAILRFIQNWSIAFEGKHSLGYVGQVYKTLQGEGYKFPPKDLAVANSAMVDTQTAPEWIDSDVCLRCRTAFTFTNRKHHCRNCGQVFDQQCSSKALPLPHFGITQEVRVCDGCHAKLTRKAERDKTDKRHRSTGSLHNNSRHQSAQALADAELQRAIELSLQEANSSRGYAPSQTSISHWQPSEPPLVDRKAYSSRKMPTDEDDDPELKAAIEASLREANAPRPSAPVALDVPRAEELPSTYDPHHSQPYTPAPTLSQPPLPKLPNYDLDPLEADAILTFNQTVEQVQANGGRDLSRYPAVTELYDKANSLRPKLALNLDDAGRKEQMLSEMHGKLSQAVKLYDQILTEQVIHPRWRASHTQYQPTSPSHNHDQWAPTPQTPAPQVANLHPQASVPPVTNQYHPAPVQYTAPPQQVTQVPAQPQQTSEYTSGQAHYGQPIQQYFPPQTPGRQASLPSPMPQQQPPQGIPHFPPVHANASTSSYAPPSTIMTPAPPVQSPPPPAVSQSRSPQFGYSSPAHSDTPSLSHVPAQNVSLGRSNTMAHPGFQQRAPPPQQHPPNQTASTLPQFPLVPTTAPMYDTSIHNGVVRSEERKEALLIDL